MPEFSLKRVEELQRQLASVHRQINEELEFQKASLVEEAALLADEKEKWKNGANLEKVQLKDRVKLDVGGTIFAASLQTLR